MVELKGTPQDDVEIYVSVDDIYEALNDAEKVKMFELFLYNDPELVMKPLREYQEAGE